MKAFLDKSASIKMHRGAVVTGTITDPMGQPVSDAVVVWGDNPYDQEGSQEVRINAEGVYQLQPLNSGRMNVTVVAPVGALSLELLISKLAGPLKTFN